jgi:hypothetical protein
LIYPFDVLVDRADEAAHFKEQIAGTLSRDPIHDRTENAVIADSGAAEFFTV